MEGPKTVCQSCWKQEEAKQFGMAVCPGNAMAFLICTIFVGEIPDSLVGMTGAIFGIAISLGMSISLFNAAGFLTYVAGSHKNATGSRINSTGCRINATGSCTNATGSCTNATGSHTNATQSQMNVVFLRAVLLLYAVLRVSSAMPVTSVLPKASLQTTVLSASEVLLSCRLDYNGDMDEISFELFNGKYSCMQCKMNYCRKIVRNNCGIEWLRSENNRTMMFSVKLNGRCDETKNLRCSFSKVTGTLETSEIFTRLHAQSDPPIISVKDGQPVETSPEPLLMTCIITNMCRKAEQYIYGDVPIQLVNTTHVAEGSRFNTTATFRAIFSEPGNYTIYCEEKGKDDIYATNVMVSPSSKVSHVKDCTNGKSDIILGVAVTVGIFIATVAAAIVVYVLVKRNYIPTCWTSTSRNTVGKEEVSDEDQNAPALNETSC